MRGAHGDVLVCSERFDVALELLAPARRLADRTSAAVTCVQIGSLATPETGAPLRHGADRLLVVEDERCAVVAALHAAAMLEALRRVRPGILLMGATIHGTEVAARLAQHLGVGCASECLDIELEQDEVIVRRYCLGGFIARQVVLSRPAVATIQPRRFEPPVTTPHPRGESQKLDVDLPPPRTRTVASEPRRRSGADIDRAEVIVAVGRGLRSREDLPLIERLARALGGAIAATRPLTDELAWLPADAKIGLSGRTVRPKLYLACGISGQIEHLVGMRESGTVVAINTDAGAPIMQEADYRVVGDLHEILPALTRLIEG